MSSPSSTVHGGQHYDTKYGSWLTKFGGLCLDQLVYISSVYIPGTAYQYGLKNRRSKYCMQQLHYPAYPILLRYSSCRYNERQLIDVTVVRRVRPRAEHNVRTYRFLPADTRYIRILRTWYHKVWYVRTWYHTVVACDNNNSVLPTPLKPRLVEHTHKVHTSFWDVAIRNSLRSNNEAVFCL